MKKLLFSALVLTLTCSRVFADGSDDFPGVRALMTPEQFNEAGLDKLSEDEIEALDSWLIGYTVGEAAVIRGTSEEVREADEKQVITANIKQPFKGWTGETVFYLDNDQIWKQRVDGRFQYSGADTRVEIKKGLFGNYNMKLLATGKAIGVTRVR